MSKFCIFVIFAIAVQCALSAPAQSNTTPVPIIHQEQEHDGFGNFRNSYETGNGIQAENSGNLKTVRVPKVDEKGNPVGGEEDAYAQVQTGKYSYLQDDGTLIELR